MAVLLRNILLKNKALKFFSLLLAISLWIFVMGEKEAEFSFSDVPLVLINKPADLIITHQTTDRISLRVGGSRTILATLSSSTIKATIDLEGVKPGTTTVKSLIDKVKLPNGTKITSISPAEFSLTLEPITNKKVPIHLAMEGMPREGYEISHIAIKPEFVEVSLAKSEAKELEKIMTEPLNISEAREDIEKEIALELTGLSPPRTVSKKRVRVSVTISEKVVEEVLPSLVVEVINTLYKTKIAPSTVQLTVRGPYQLVKGLSEHGISASIDLKGIKPGTYSRKAEIKLPENVNLIEVKPQWFKIVVSKELLNK